MFIKSFFLFQENAGSSAIIGNGPFHLILYAAVIISVTWILLRSQTRALFRTMKLLKEKDEALRLIESKRAELEFKDRNITESLIYAQRIQDALLPSSEYFNRLFTRSFILYKPRDIVSGDFFWIGDKNGKRFVVAADCTGHGVPGALMSMIGHDLLERIINNEGIVCPGEILERINRALTETFSSEKNTSAVIRDGMDMGVCSIDLKMKKIEFAGAFFPLFVIRDNRLIEIRGSKYTLGITAPGAVYENNEMDLMNEDIFYLFSDGYVDQFGGEENKKFMYRRFRYLLMNIHKFPFEDQKSILEENIRTWQGSNPQVDDILIIGFKPL